MQVGIRPVSESDFNEIVAMLDSVMTGGMTLPEFRSIYTSLSPVNRCMVAIDGSQSVVGWSRLRRGENELPTRASTTVVVHPKHRRVGIGSDIFEDILTYARSVGLTTLRARVKDGEPGWLAWAKAKGFEVNRRTFDSRLVLATFEDGPFLSHIADLESDGINFTTLSEIGDTEENRREYYDSGVETGEDPNNILEADPDDDPWPSWEEYEAEFFGHDGYHPDGAYLALDGERIVGVANVLLEAPPG